MYVNPVGETGGAERSLGRLIAGLRELNPAIEPHVILGSDGSAVDWLKKCGAVVEILKLPNSLGRIGDSGLQGQSGFAKMSTLAAIAPVALLALLRYSRALRRRFSELRPEIVHSNGLKSHVATAASCPTNVPLIWHVRDFIGERPYVGMVLRRQQKRVRAVIGNSQAVCEDVRRTLPNCRVFPVLNGVELSQFTPGTGDGRWLDEAAGMPIANTPVVRIGLVATYARWKGHEVFLEALGKLPAQLPMRGYIIGAPIYTTSGSQWTREELLRIADRNQLRDRIGLVPFQSDMPRVFQSLDIVVHASTRPEPFGLSIAEAMACGCSVIVAAAGGALELFTDGYDALGHRPGNATELSEKMACLISNPSLRSTLGTSARGTAEARLGIERCVQQIDDIYQLLLNRLDA